MKKDELVQLHGLLTLLRAEYERRGAVAEEAFAAYDDLDVSPMAVYGSKDEHARAVQALASALAAASSPGDEGSPGADRDHTERNATAQS
ncbi:MAG: UPF0058 family protein [Haloarculaceae archaeon]